MTSFLRTASTRRLLTVIAGAIAVVAAGTAIAVAAAGNGPVPAAKALPNAIHDALAAPAIQGISARVTFTNHLIDASSIQGSDPLLQGGSGRLWLSPSQHRLRIELQSPNGDAQLVVNNGAFWVYDPMSKTVYEGTLPKDSAKATTSTKPGTIPSLADIQKQLSKLTQHLDLSAAIPGDIAGKAAFSVRVSPRHAGGLLGAAELGWDATHGVPLSFAIYARGTSSPVLELKATDISYGPVTSGDFNAAPPPGSQVVKVATPSGQHSASSAKPAKDTRGKRVHKAVSGAAAVAAKLPFTLAAPKAVAGLSQRSVTLLDWAHKPAALVTYGQGLGVIAVIEQSAPSGASASSSSSTSGPNGNSQVSLPTVSINGATGTELDTALGTLLRFTRAGVSYTVIGSVPPTAAELAARAL
jgi:hypothetical protein